MAATESWPAILPAPTFEGYAIEPFDGVERTDMEQGEARQTLLYTSVPERVPVRFRFTQVQYAVFRAWFKHKADRGAEWFNITLLTGLGMVSHEARFVGQGQSPYRAVPMRGDASGAKWIVTTTLEVRQSPDLTEEALDVFLAEDFTGLEAQIAAFHTLIHETLPGDGGWM